MIEVEEFLTSKLDQPAEDRVIPAEAMHYIDQCVEYSIMNEWNYINEELSNEMEPKDSILWSCLMVNHLVHGYTHPADRFMEELTGIEVSRDGYITNKEEYFE